jgi:hypothetical protein
MTVRFTPRFALVALLLILIVVPLGGVLAQTAPATPVLVSPADGSIQNTHLPFLEWTGADADTYKIVIKNPDGTKFFKKQVNAADVCSGTDCGYSLVSDGVSFDRNDEGYSWKVTAINAVGKAKSASAVFAIDFPGAPELESPLEGATVSGDVTFMWNEVTAANFYTLIVKNTVTKQKQKALLYLSQSPICSAGLCEYAFSQPLSAGTYSWKVKAEQQPLPNSSKSEKRLFTVSAD